MDSEDSRPGSAASNSSSSLSDNSKRNTPTPNIEEQISSKPASVASPASSNGYRRSPRSRQGSSGSSRRDVRSPRSLSKSQSESSSSSSSSDNDDDEKSALSDTKAKNKSSSEGSSSDDEAPDVPPSPTASPTTRSRLSSRNSSDSNVGQCRSRSNSKEFVGNNVNVCHEDLSDVSDMESEKRTASLNNSKNSVFEEGREITNGSPSLEPPADTIEQAEGQSLVNCSNTESAITDLRQKLDQKKSQIKVTESNEIAESETSDANKNSSEVIEGLVKAHGEDSLDFEAEEGECHELKNNANEKKEGHKDKLSEKLNGECDDDDEGELEEGEVTDEDEKRPEETEPKPVCRFFTRGQCTWGMSCRFLHPGVTDKGNYTMFDLVRSVPVQGGTSGSRQASSYTSHAADYVDFRTERPPLHHRSTLSHQSSIYPTNETRSLTSPVLPAGPVVVESAWERGLRTAKEMMRKASKRKEQDMDFEDKKMNLTLSPDEIEKDPYYLKEITTPPKVTPYVRHGLYQEPIYGSPDRFGRTLPASAYDEDPYARSSRYRELPPHRMPQYEDERRVRPTREVIVQRVDQIGRADEWNDPWMRSKSPSGRGPSRERSEKRRRDRSYSSNSSYSSSSSSESDSSSETSHSASPSEQRRRYNSTSHKSPTLRRHARTARSPSISKRRIKRSPNTRRSPITKRRGHLSPLAVTEKRSAHGLEQARKKVSTLSKKPTGEKLKTKTRHGSSSSETGSSASSASDSESNSETTTSRSSSTSKGHTLPKRARLLEKAPTNNDRNIVKKDIPKKRSPISIEIKKQTTVGASALRSPTDSVSSEKDSKKTRREELLKQLRAVEDAIAKKRSKLT